MENSLEDYRALFALDDGELSHPIVVYPAGISSFSAQMYKNGRVGVVSVDPYYDLAPMDMMKHVNFVIQRLAEIAQDESANGVMNAWNACAQAFLADYSVGQKEGRYVPATRSLPYQDGSFPLALCPYREGGSQGQLTYHRIIQELCRIAREVRVSPLMNAAGEIVPELGSVMVALQKMNWGVEIRAITCPVSQKKGAMLRIWSKECVVA